MHRLDLNNPPTSVGGIPEFLKPIPFSLDLNHPPTAVGGIAEFSHNLGSGWVSLRNYSIIKVRQIISLPD